MTALIEHLRRRIAFDGPLTVADYMETCLLHPEHGYYMTHPAIGAEGDFITAPEISQMFGELIGLALAQSWIDQGAPNAFTLAELGPGRGVLMADVLRATRQVPGFHSALSLHLVERSAGMRAAQLSELSAFNPVFHDDARELPTERPLYLIANEFFDALPIRQFLRDGDNWRERCVGLDGDALTWGVSPATAQPDLAHRLQDTQDGDMVELGPDAQRIARAIGERIQAHGGAALVIDYGTWRSKGDTVQALYRKQKSPPLAHPGASDLTAHVDFESLANAAPCAHSALTSQGVFLERLGITERARRLAAAAGGKPRDRIASAHRRLTHPDEMGSLFKVLALHPASAPPPPGLHP